MTDREPCVRCGEKVPVEARACPYCNRSALVDLMVDQPVTDGRKRFRIARAIAALGAEAPPTANVQQALLKKDGVVAAGVTKAFAHRAFQALAAEEVASSLALSAEVAKRSFPWRSIAAVLGLVALGAFGVLNWRRMVAVPARDAAPSPAATAAAAPAPAARNTALSTKELAARALPSTVSIRCPNSVGSGFFVTDELVLTNEHVVCPGGGAIEVVRSDGQTQTGASVQTDPRLDLALIRVTGAAATPLPLGDVGELVVGEQVMVIGSPMGLEFTVHPGIVSNVSRVLYGLSYVQVDAQVNPGNSGGPVLNDRGQVVGVVSLKHMGAEGIGLALPVNYAWSGQNPLLPAPAGANSTAFAGRQAQADAQNREMRQAVAAAEALPALLGGYVDPYRRLVVRIGRLATTPPEFEIFTLKLMRGPEELCSMQGDVSEWKEISGQPNLDARLKSWMEGNQLDRRKYVGDAPIRIDQCPAQRSLVGLELVLVGGHPQVSRVAIR